MKKKLLTLLTVLILALASCFAFVGCKKEEEVEDTRNQEIVEVYNMYVAYAEEKGLAPLSYEAWLTTIKGEKGDTGAQGIQGEKGDKGDVGISVVNAYINENGDLIIVLSDNREINAGNLHETPAEESSSINFTTLTLVDGIYYKKVSNDVTEFDFNDEVTGNAKYKISLDKYGFNQSLTKKIPLAVGDNLVYLFEYNNDEIIKTYEINVYRTKVYTVNFESYSSVVDAQYVIENELAKQPEVNSTLDGYAFLGWDYDFSTPITGDITIRAIFKSLSLTFDESGHWYPRFNGDDKFDFEEHINDSGKCSKCDYYFDCTEYLTFEMATIDGNVGYRVIGYDGYNSHAYEHIEIPAYYQGEDDVKPVPVIAINDHLFSTTYNSGYKAIKSIKFNEGLLYIGDSSFVGTDIEEVYIPNSVIGSGTDRGREGLYNTFGNCTKLKKAMIGNGVKSLYGYVFSGCTNLEEVILGDNVQTIKQRAFYGCIKLKNIVIPKSLTFVPESGISSSAVGKVIPLICILPYAENVYMEITEEQYEELLVPIRDRDDETGEILNPIDYGFVDGWSGVATIYFKGEWHYDENGKPVANSQN